MQTAMVLFAFAALGGITIAILRLRGTPRPPTWMALGHGAVAASGLIAFLYAAATQTLPMLALISLAGFVLAAVGGLTLFIGFHLREKALPIPLVLAHGALALTSFGILLAAVFG